MSQYLLLHNIEVQNANCTAGFTWGFPAITHFLGFTHAIHRQLTHEYDINFEGCAVICHKHFTHTYQSQKGRDFEFIQSKNPPYLPTHNKDKNAPIVEEGRMNMTVSLVISLDKELNANSEKKESFESKVKELCCRSKLAGGIILNIQGVTLYTSRSKQEQTNVCRIVRNKLKPGFVLVDRSDTLATYYQSLKEIDNDTQLLDAWTRFSELRYTAKPQIKSGEVPDKNTNAEWEWVNRPANGWIVPIMSGYKAISPEYPAGEVANVRDETTPTRFVEAIHTIGEWRSTYHIKELAPFIWKYRVEGEWYLCQQSPMANSQTTSQQVVETRVVSFKQH